MFAGFRFVFGDSNWNLTTKDLNGSLNDKHTSQKKKKIDGYRFKSDLIEGFINVINSMQNHDSHKILKKTFYINCC